MWSKYWWFLETCPRSKCYRTFTLLGRKRSGDSVAQWRCQVCSLRSSVSIGFPVPPGLDPFLRNSGRQAEFHRAYGPGMTWKKWHSASESGRSGRLVCKGILFMRYNGLHYNHYQNIQYVHGKLALRDEIPHCSQTAAYGIVNKEPSGWSPCPVEYTCDERDERDEWWACVMTRLFLFFIEVHHVSSCSTM